MDGVDARASVGASRPRHHHMAVLILGSVATPVPN